MDDFEQSVLHSKKTGCILYGMGFFQEFKTFAMRGNAMDLAVGVIIGAAFGKVVTSLVGDILMPPLGVLVGGMDFSSLSLTLKQASGSTPASQIRYGEFINTVINFMIVSFAIFALIKGMNRLKNSLQRQKEDKKQDERLCPECCLPIPQAARRCGHCGQPCLPQQ